MTALLHKQRVVPFYPSVTSKATFRLRVVGGFCFPPLRFGNIATITATCFTAG